MAKTDEIKFFDQHVEKVVFGVCAMIMAYGAFQWVLSAPLRSEVPDVKGREVAAQDLDQELLDWANEIRNRPSKHDPKSAIPDYDIAIAKQRAPADAYAIGNWGDYRQVLVPQKRFKEPERPDLKKMADILAELSPTITEVKGLRELVDQGGGVDKLVFRGKAQFPKAQLLKAWNKVLRGSAMDEVNAVAMAVEIERRTVLGPGQFGPSSVIAQAVITRQDVEPRKPVVIPDYDGKTTSDVREAIENFSKTEQKNILRPEYWKVWSQTKQKWTTPWIKEPDAPTPGAAAVSPARAEVEPETAPDTIELWFNDNDVIVQRQYSYRMRISFVSPLYTYDDVVPKDKPEDAKVKAVASGWSDWVAGQAIPRTTQYFLTRAGGMGSDRRLYCTIFTRSMGQVVVEEKFEATPGRIIGGVMSKQIKNPAGGLMVAKVVDFSTNATVIHVEFEKKFITSTGRKDETRELICLEDGKLVSNILVKDMSPDDPRAQAFKKLQAQTERKGP